MQSYSAGVCARVEAKSEGLYNPGRREVCQWINSANKKLPKQMIADGFAKLVLPEKVHGVAAAAAATPAEDDDDETPDVVEVLDDDEDSNSDASAVVEAAATAEDEAIAAQMQSEVPDGVAAMADELELADGADRHLNAVLLRATAAARRCGSARSKAARRCCTRGAPRTTAQ